MNEQETKEYEAYIESGAYKKELKYIIIGIIILSIITIIVAIATAPHYTPEQLACIKSNPLSKYMCGV